MRFLRNGRQPGGTRSVSAPPRSYRRSRTSGRIRQGARQKGSMRRSRSCRISRGSGPSSRPGADDGRIAASFRNSRRARSGPVCVKARPGDRRRSVSIEGGDPGRQGPYPRGCKAILDAARAAPAAAPAAPAVAAPAPAAGRSLRGCVDHQAERESARTVRPEQEESDDG